MKDVETTQKFWRREISVLKVKNNCRKLNVVARDQVKITMDLMNLHKEVFLTRGIFFGEQDSILSDVNSENLFHGCQ